MSEREAAAPDSAMIIITYAITNDLPGGQPWQPGEGWTRVKNRRDDMLGDGWTYWRKIELKT